MISVKYRILIKALIWKVTIWKCARVDPSLCVISSLIDDKPQAQFSLAPLCCQSVQVATTTCRDTMLKAQGGVRQEELIQQQAESSKERERRFAFATYCTPTDQKYQPPSSAPFNPIIKEQSGAKQLLSFVLTFLFFALQKKIIWHLHQI